MRRYVTLLLLALLCAGGVAWAENYFLSVSATTTAATKRFRASDSVMLCNASGSANIAYARLFDVSDVAQGKVEDATSAYTDIQIASCKTWTRGSGRPQWAAVSIISAGTSTVTIDAD